MEEASASLGARRDVTFRRVVLPLIRPALLAGMTVLFIRAMTAISATIFLVSLSWSLVTVRILERSEEHTSELQSQSNLVCRLLLEKKKKTSTHRSQFSNRDLPDTLVSSVTRHSLSTLRSPLPESSVLIEMSPTQYILSTTSQ